jgi:hypothetical protein
MTTTQSTTADTTPIIVGDLELGDKIANWAGKVATITRITRRDQWMDFTLAVPVTQGVHAGTTELESCSRLRASWTELHH